MALETGTHADDLVATNPPGSDDRSTADDHIRFFKQIIKNQLCDASAPWKLSYGVDGGAANGVIITMAPAPAAYTATMLILFQCKYLNTGAATLKVNSLATQALEKDNVALTGGELEVDRYYLAAHDGTAFQLINFTDLRNTKLLCFDTEYDNGTVTASGLAIDWNNGIKQKVTVGNAGHTLTFTDPPGPCHIQLRIFQDAAGSFDITTWPTIVTPGGGASSWSLSSGGGDVDYLNLFFDGSGYGGQLSKDWY